MVNHLRRTTITEENTPLPIVYYPGVLGTFIAFSEKPDSEYVFCQCFKTAIKNYFLIEKPKFIKNKPPKNKIKQFHSRVIGILERERIDSFEGFENCFTFSGNICHECNKVTPAITLESVYGLPSFAETHDWYIKKQTYEFGINPYTHIYSGIELIESCPKEITDLNEISDETIQGFYSEYEELRRIDDAEANDLLRAQLYGVYQQRKNIRDHIENLVREKFGFKRIGQAWVSETNLYMLVRSMFPGENIVQHFRSPFLKGLELDIYLPDRKLGIEYQGIQHYEPIEHWGGKESLAALQVRDRIKSKYCLENGISLVYFYHYEKITMELVRMKLKEYT